METGITCHVHPASPAVGACVDCGHFVCDVCRVSISGRIHCKACLERGATTGPGGGAGKSPPAPRSPRPFTRSAHDKVLGGVCGGLAAYLGLDAALTRVLFAVATVLTGFLLGGIVYLVMWATVPLEPDGERW